MYSEREVLIYHAESPLHPGAGSDVGHIDNPIQRERATTNPKVQGNGIKGALRDFFDEVLHVNEHKREAKITAVFGRKDSGDDGSGAISIGEARLLFFPLRSLSGLFAYVTCPSLLARLQRDLVACGKSPLNITDQKGKKVYSTVHNDSYLAHSGATIDVSNHTTLVLEEWLFSRQEGNVDSILDEIAARIFPQSPEYEHFRDNFSKRVAILDDTEYKHFVNFSTEVEPHNRIDDKTGTVDENTGVWYTEYLPSESILYSPLFIGEPKIRNEAFKDAGEVKQFISKVNDQRTWLGGDITTGKGRVMMHLLGEPEPATKHKGTKED